MNGYEIIRRNIEFDNPERVGLRFQGLGISDVFRIYVQPPKAIRPEGSGAVRMDKKIRTPAGHIDSWGCQWEAMGDSTDGEMGMVVDPPLKDLDALEAYPFPDPYDPDLFEGLEEALAAAGDKFVQINSPFCMFERLHFLRGFEEVMKDLVTRPDRLEALLDKIIDYQIGIVEMAGQLGKGRIHCFDTTDDWGTQTNMFISPKMWRKFFKPRYQRLMDAIHANDMVIRFHTDGRINAILDDLVELGMDILNVHQPRLLGIDEVAEKLAGRICFEVSADIQVTLPGGDREKIRDEVKQVVQKWASPKGGLIGIEYRYGQAIGITPQALKWELEAFLEYGKYR